MRIPILILTTIISCVVTGEKTISTSTSTTLKTSISNSKPTTSIKTNSTKRATDTRGKRTLYDIGTYPSYLQHPQIGRRIGNDYGQGRAYFGNGGYENGQYAQYPGFIQDPSNYLPPDHQNHGYYPQPQYIEAPEPIIEIIIKESNETADAPPPEPIVQKKKKEKVQVFYVNYKKDKNNKLHLETPIASLEPNNQHQSEDDEEEVVHYAATPIPPVKTTTLRTIIHPESEQYHSNSGIHVTFNTEDKSQSGHQLQEHNEESVINSVVALPSSTNNFVSYQEPRFSHYKEQTDRHKFQSQQIANFPPPLPVEHRFSGPPTRQPNAQLRSDFSQPRLINNFRSQNNVKIDDYRGPPPPLPQQSGSPPPLFNQGPTFPDFPPAQHYVSQKLQIPADEPSQPFRSFVNQYQVTHTNNYQHQFHQHAQQYQQRPPLEQQVTSHQSPPHRPVPQKSTTLSLPKQQNVIRFPTIPPHTEKQQSLPQYQPVKFRPTPITQHKTASAPIKPEPHQSHAGLQFNQQQFEHQHQHQINHNYQQELNQKQETLIRPPSFSPAPQQQSNYQNFNQQTNSQSNSQSQHSSQSNQQNFNKNSNISPSGHHHDLSAVQAILGEQTHSELVSSVPKFEQHITEYVNLPPQQVKNPYSAQTHYNQQPNSQNQAQPSQQVNTKVPFNQFSYSNKNEVIQNIPAPKLGPTSPNPNNYQNKLESSPLSNQHDRFILSSTPQYNNYESSKYINSNSQQNYVSSTPQQHYASSTPQYTETKSGEQIQVVTPSANKQFSSFSQQNQYKVQQVQPQIIPNSQPLHEQQQTYAVQQNQGQKTNFVNQGQQLPQPSFLSQQHQEEQSHYREQSQQANFASQQRQVQQSSYTTQIKHEQQQQQQHNYANEPQPKRTQQQPNYSSGTGQGVSNLHTDAFQDLERKRNEYLANLQFNQQQSSQNYVSIQGKNKQPSHEEQSIPKETNPTSKPISNSPTQKTEVIRQKELELPDEVPEELRQQLLSSGILANADISVLDYDKVGGVNLENLPAEHLAHFYGNGGGAQISESQKVLSVVKPNGDKVDFTQKQIEKVKETNTLPRRQNVDLKVVRFDSKTQKSVTDKYLRPDSTVLPTVNIPSEKQYNRYLPLKVSGAQFPIPETDELKGKKIASVVVLAPVDSRMDSTSDNRRERDILNSKQVKFIAGDTLKQLIKKPTKDNFKKWLEKESKTDIDLQSVVLLVAKNSGEEEKEIFMYDIGTQAINKLSGELSTAFVNVAEENASSEDLENVNLTDSGIIEKMLSTSSEENDDQDSASSNIYETVVKFSPQQKSNSNLETEDSSSNKNSPSNKISINSGYSNIKNE